MRFWSKCFSLLLMVTGVGCGLAPRPAVSPSIAMTRVVTPATLDATTIPAWLTLAVPESQPTNLRVVFNCAAFTGISPLSVDLPIEDGQPTRITGCHFGATEGEVELCNASAHSGATCVDATVTSWSSTDITATINAGSFVNGQQVWLYVRDSTSAVNAFGLGPVSLAVSGGSCAFPDCFPDATNTGYSGTLTPSGSISTSSNGQVIQNVDVNGGITVTHDNVTIRNCLIRNAWPAIVVGVDVHGLLVEDCELDGTGASGGQSAAETWEQDNIYRRVYVHGFAEGIGGSNGQVYDSYFTDFFDCTPGCHQDGIVQFESGSNGAIIRHNTCELMVDGGNACVTFGSDSANNMTEENSFQTMGSYCVRSGGTGGTIRNNLFKPTAPDWPNCGFFGAIEAVGSNTKCGNKLGTTYPGGTLLSGESACS